MVKPKLFLVFRPVEGRWLSAEGTLLADFLSGRGMVIDDRTQFARLYDYDECECIVYRAYGCQKITITIYTIDLP